MLDEQAGSLPQLYAVSSLKASPSYWSPDSYGLTSCLWAWLLPHCLLAYEILSTQQSERTVTHRENECAHLWEQRKWSTQEPLSQPIVWEQSQVGGMRGKLCLRNEGQSCQRVCVYLCMCVCSEVCVCKGSTPPCGPGLTGTSCYCPSVKEKMKAQVVKCWFFLI